MVDVYILNLITVHKDTGCHLQTHTDNFISCNQCLVFEVSCETVHIRNK